MKKIVQILLLSFLPLISFSQDNTDALFTEALVQLSKSEKLRGLIGTTHDGRNAMFFSYHNLKYTNLSEEYSIYLWTKTYLFGKPVNCYMEIDSLEQKGKNILIYFRIDGEGNERCNAKTGIAKFKNLGEAKLELTKLKIK